MNILLLLMAVRPWRVRPAAARLTLVLAAISLFSLEMQAITWWHLGTIATLPAFNAVLAAALIVSWRRQRPYPDLAPVPMGDAVPLAATLLLAAVTLALNLGLPMEAADPYHLDKVDRIVRIGTLAYDGILPSKVDVLSSLYELLLADLRLVPAIGSLLMRLQGLWSLWLYVLAVAATRELLRDGDPPLTQGRPRLDPGSTLGQGWDAWPWSVMLVVPPVFHQLVLIKNDLFVALFAMAAFAWVVARSRDASAGETAWAASFAGFAVAIKLTTLPLVLVFALALLLRRWREWRCIAAAAIGGAAGVVAGGLLFTLAENARVYGHMAPVDAENNVNRSVTAAVVGLSRFGLSLIDLGLATRNLWPGRGGWGGNFGLPVIWAGVVLVWAWRRDARARGAVGWAALYLLVFGLIFPDADIAQRMALGPMLASIALAVSIVQRHAEARWLRHALAAVILLSAAQIARSAVLYASR